MKFIRIILVSAAIFFGGLASAPALARGHAHFGVFIGAPVIAPWYYPAPYYPPYYAYAPAPVVTAPAPPVYIEQQAPPAAPQQSSSWYYCPQSKGYYPYVRQCPGGWQRVPAQPR